jgi:hypothetical protein
MKGDQVRYTISGYIFKYISATDRFSAKSKQNRVNMWHLTKYARFVETATTSSESKNTWEVINY